MQDSEGIAAVRPYQHQRILALGHTGKGVLGVGGVGRRMTIDADHDAPGLQSGFIGRTARLHLLDHCALNVARLCAEGPLPS